jgi:hypothetical protein
MQLHLPSSIPFVHPCESPLAVCVIVCNCGLSLGSNAGRARANARLPLDYRWDGGLSGGAVALRRMTPCDTFRERPNRAGLAYAHLYRVRLGSASPCDQPLRDFRVSQGVATRYVQQIPRPRPNVVTKVVQQGAMSDRGVNPQWAVFQDARIICGARPHRRMLEPANCDLHRVRAVTRDGRDF